MKFKVGDRVRVINWGKMYDCDVSWFRRHEDMIDIELVARYAFNDSRKYTECQYTDDTIYTINYLTDTEALISESDYRKVYLIGLEGLCFAYAPRRMTLSEIEDKLGYRVEIISEDQNQF